MAKYGRMQSMEFREGVPLAPLTTFHIGGPARYFVEVTSEGELLRALLLAKERALSYVVLAGGSNVLVADSGFDGVVIKNGIKQSEQDGNILTLGAGNTLWDEIQATSRNGLGGWESLAGIPGSIGGAVRGNAGAFGTEMKDVVKEVRALNVETHAVETFTNEQCEFNYRQGIFKRRPELVITRVVLALRPVDLRESQRHVQDTVSEREKRHIQNVRAAGSYFANPVVREELQKLFKEEKGSESRGGRVPAGWLIEKVGLKGARVGGAVASEQHPNYITNTGNATAADVLALATQIKTTVQEQFDVALAEEVSHIGISNT